MTDKHAASGLAVILALVIPFGLFLWWLTLGSSTIEVGPSQAITLSQPGYASHLAVEISGDQPTYCYVYGAQESATSQDLITTANPLYTDPTGEGAHKRDLPFFYTECYVWCHIVHSDDELFDNGPHWHAFTGAVDRAPVLIGSLPHQPNRASLMNSLMTPATNRVSDTSISSTDAAGPHWQTFAGPVVNTAPTTQRPNLRIKLDPIEPRQYRSTFQPSEADKSAGSAQLPTRETMTVALESETAPNCQSDRPSAFQSDRTTSIRRMQAWANTQGGPVAEATEDESHQAEQNTGKPMSRLQCADVFPSAATQQKFGFLYEDMNVSESLDSVAKLFAASLLIHSSHFIRMVARCPGWCALQRL